MVVCMRGRRGAAGGGQLCCEVGCRMSTDYYTFFQSAVRNFSLENFQTFFVLEEGNELRLFLHHFIALLYIKLHDLVYVGRGFPLYLKTEARSTVLLCLDDSYY